MKRLYGQEFLDAELRIMRQIPKKHRGRERAPGTRLTHRRRTEGRGYEYEQVRSVASRPSRICLDCGADIRGKSTVCQKCSRDVARKSMLDIAKAGRILAQSADAQKRRGYANRKHTLAAYRWKPSDNPAWLNEQVYRRDIYPRLAQQTVMAIATAIKVSESYAADIRAGRHRPHARHWEKLANVVGFEREEKTESQ